MKHGAGQQGGIAGGGQLGAQGSEALHIWRPRPLVRAIEWRPREQPLTAGSAGYEVFVMQDTFSELISRARGRDVQSSFGFLVGDLCECPESGIKYVLVTSTIEARFRFAETATPQIPPEAYVAMQLKLDRRVGTLVGWFHSHADVDEVRLSENDIATHHKYFNEPWQSALVLVPRAERPLGGFFRSSAEGLNGDLLRPFYEVLSARSFVARGVRYTCVNWANYASEGEAELVPLGNEGDRVTTHAPARPASTVVKPAKPAPAPRPAPEASSERLAGAASDEAVAAEEKASEERPGTPDADHRGSTSWLKQATTPTPRRKPAPSPARPDSAAPRPEAPRPTSLTADFVDLRTDRSKTDTPTVDRRRPGSEAEPGERRVSSAPEQELPKGSPPPSGGRPPWSAGASESVEADLLLTEADLLLTSEPGPSINRLADRQGDGVDRRLAGLHAAYPARAPADPEPTVQPQRPSAPPAQRVERKSEAASETDTARASKPAVRRRKRREARTSGSSKPRWRDRRVVGMAAVAVVVVTAGVVAALKVPDLLTERAEPPDVPTLVGGGSAGAGDDAARESGSALGTVGAGTVVGAPSDGDGAARASSVTTPEAGHNLGTASAARDSLAARAGTEVPGAQGPNSGGTAEGVPPSVAAEVARLARPLPDQAYGAPVLALDGTVVELNDERARQAAAERQAQQAAVEDRASRARVQRLRTPVVAAPAAAGPGADLKDVSIVRPELLLKLDQLSDSLSNALNRYFVEVLALQNKEASCDEVEQAYRVVADAWNAYNQALGSPRIVRFEGARAARDVRLSERVVEVERNFETVDCD